MAPSRSHSKLCMNVMNKIMNKSLKKVFVCVVLTAPAHLLCEDVRLRKCFTRYGNTIIAQDSQEQEVGRITFSDCWINRLYVNHALQKQGIGSKLFHKAVKQMNSCDVVRWNSYLSALPFYHKQGATVHPGFYNRSSEYYTQLHAKNPKAMEPLVEMYITSQKSREKYLSKKDPQAQKKKLERMQIDRWRNLMMCTGNGI